MNKQIAILNYPKCPGATSLEISTDKCLTFYICEKCRELIAASKECCAIYEYSNKKYPARKL